MPSMINPDLLYTVLCDDVRREDNGKWMLIGLFEQIAVGSFPAQHPQCSVVNKWTNGVGTFAQQTRFIDENDTIIIQSDDLKFELADLNASFTAVQTFAGLPLNRAGKIWIEIYLDGDLRQRYPLRVETVDQRTA